MLELNVLEAIDGVISAKTFPAGRTDSNINNNIVVVKISRDEYISRLLSRGGLA